MSRLVSPQELHDAACEQMLKGRKPQSTLDWQLVANFWAANIADGLAVAALPLLGLIFQCPLTKVELESIALFQASRSKATSSPNTKKGE